MCVGRAAPHSRCFHAGSLSRGRWQAPHPAFQAAAASSEGLLNGCTLFNGSASWAPVQAAIGASRAAAFDLTAACSGFVMGLVTGAQYIRAGSYKTVLVIGAPGAGGRRGCAGGARLTFAAAAACTALFIPPAVECHR